VFHSPVEGQDRGEEAKDVSSGDDRASSWTFLTHHARVLVEIARNPDIRLRDIAAGIGITERAVQNIVRDLHDGGYLSRDRVGRRNRYSLNLEQHFRYPTEAGLPIRLLIDMFTQHDLSHDRKADELSPDRP
jgi:DNA-binding Lrp family transcriptional regulator